MSDTGDKRSVTLDDGVAPTPWPFIALAAMAVSAPIVLVMGHAAKAGPAIAAAIAVAIGAIALGIVSSGRHRVVPQPEDAGAEESTEPFAAMIEQIADPILLVAGGARDEQSSRKFLFANGAARDLLRIQRPDGLLTTVIRAPDILDAVDDALYNDKSGEAAYQLRGPQDRVWRARVSPLDVNFGDGSRLALLWMRDETELRRTERARADFLANASHELRTPLASLTGFIETLRGHARDDVEARDKFLAIMHGQADRMRRLIDDLMSLSRIELGEHIPPSGVVDLRVLVTDVMDALAPLATERGVRFDSSLPITPALAVADRDQIVQVVQNLAENAVKYAPDGGVVRLEVAPNLTLAQAATASAGLEGHFSLLTPEHAQGRTYVAVRVRDFGPGMARGHLPRLTERFYRVEGQRLRKPGTGLGLAIVKHIINRHRGGLIVESAPGEGALFTAYLPAAPAIDVLARTSPQDALDLTS
jgi:two-component system phosphate regulon sensor histidine kinase PhoR